MQIAVGAASTKTKIPLCSVHLGRCSFWDSQHWFASGIVRPLRHNDEAQVELLEALETFHQHCRPNGNRAIQVKLYRLVQQHVMFCMSPSTRKRERPSSSIFWQKSKHPSIWRGESRYWPNVNTTESFEIVTFRNCCATGDQRVRECASLARTLHHLLMTLLTLWRRHQCNAALHIHVTGWTHLKAMRRSSIKRFILIKSELIPPLSIMISLASRNKYLSTNSECRGLLVFLAYTFQYSP